MDFAKDIVRADAEYNKWATRRLLVASSALTAAELTLDIKLSHRSVLQTLNHYFDSEQFWIECLEKRSMPPMGNIGDSGEPPMIPLEELKLQWEGVWAKLDKWLAPRSEEDLSETISSAMPSGRILEFPIWQLIRHAVNHATLHRGQVVGMLRALGKEPPNVDTIGYYISTKR